MSFRRAFAVVLLCLGMLGVAMPGWATCSSPAGEAGQFGYASNYGVLAYCNGTNWISMAGGVSVTVGGTTGATTLHELSDVDDSAKASGTYLKYNGTSWVATNPFGTLTNAKWCTSDGSTINCTTDAPVLAEVDPKVGTLTNAKWCTTDGSTITCTTDAPLTAAATLNDLADVDTTGAATGKILAYDGTNWVVSNTVSGADNLGNHTATQTLDMASHNIQSIGFLSVGSTDTNALVDISGTLKIAGTGSETCDSDHYGTFRRNPTTGAIQICVQ